MLLLVPLLWPVLTGAHFYLRDIGTTHRPAWSLFERLGFARWNDAASFGQPYRGNPNLLIAYPFPKSESAVEVCVVIHLCLLICGMALWLRRYGTLTASLAGAAAFALSGHVLSSSSSMNAIATIAWVPYVLMTAQWNDFRIRAIALRICVLAIFSLAGEPVLIAGVLFLAIALAGRTGARAAGQFLMAGAIAFALTVPVHLETFRAAAESDRVVRGYTFSQAASQTLHPARLVELVIPGFFGIPSRIGNGSWWGFAISADRLSYVYSLFVGLIPLMLVIAYGFATRLRVDRGWWTLSAAATFFAMAARVPGAKTVWEALPPFLHILRFPIKAWFFVTLAIAVLTARAWTYFSALPSIADARRRIAVCAALLALIAVAVIRFAPNIAPRASSIVANRAVVAMIVLTLLFFWIARRRSLAFEVVVLCALVVDLSIAGRPLVATTREVVVSPSPLVRAAQGLHGRIHERAFKDLESGIYGVLGAYPSNDAEWLFVAQARQAWALYGAIDGLRYAYDRSPDGSYTWRNHLVETRFETWTWPERIKWLRGVGAAGIIASDVPAGTAGVHTIAEESSVGVPVSLYAITPRLSEIRVVGQARWVHDANEAFAAFAQNSFDETRVVIIEGSPMPIGAARVTMVQATSDRMIVYAEAASAAIVFIARTYSERTRARTSNGTILRVAPANVHLCAIEVPRGVNTITVDF